MYKIFLFCKENKLICFLLFCLFLIIFITIFGSYIVPYDPYEISITNTLQPPSAEHWFGTDSLGRDLFSRVICGMRISLCSALFLIAFISLIGTILGMVAGYFGGVIDSFIMRVSDVMISFPGVVLAVSIVGIMGGSLGNAMFAIFIVSWTKYARLVRSLTLQIKNKDYMLAAKLMGTTNFNIFTKYILKMIFPTIMVMVVTDIGSMLLELSALSFLGLGAQAPTPEWGLMLNEGRDVMQSAPWIMFFAGFAIFIVVVIFNLLGDSLRDFFDIK